MRGVWAILFAVTCATGCSAYGWANRPGAAVYAEPLAVRTVDVDASSGADPAYLTRAFVDALHGAGVARAAWTTAGATEVLTCDVAVDDEASYAEALQVSASARCALDGVLVGERRGDIQIATSPRRRLSQRADAAEAASNAALAAVANDIADYLASRTAP